MSLAARYRKRAREFEGHGLYQVGTMYERAARDLEAAEKLAEALRQFLAAPAGRYVTELDQALREYDAATGTPPDEQT